MMMLMTLHTTCYLLFKVLESDGSVVETQCMFWHSRGWTLAYKITDDSASGSNMGKTLQATVCLAVARVARLCRIYCFSSLYLWTRMLHACLNPSRLVDCVKHIHTPQTHLTCVRHIHTSQTHLTAHWRPSATVLFHTLERDTA